MTLADVFEQAKALTREERQALVRMLVDSLESSPTKDEPLRPGLKTGPEIVAMLEQMEPLEFADPEIEDPVEWVQAQRRKQANRLRPYWEDEA